MPLSPFKSIIENVSVITTKITSLLTNSDTSNTKLDTINSSVGTTNTKLDITNTNTGNINTSVGTSNTKLDTINSSIGSTNSKLDTSNTNTGGTNTRLDNLSEEITGGIKSINTDHALIHDGYGLCFHGLNTTLAFGGKIIYRYTAPTTKFAHIKGIQVSAEGATIKVSLIKDVTITGAGSEITSTAIQLMNHNSTYAFESKVYNGAVTYSGGTVWCSTVVHGNTTSLSSSSGQFIQNESLEYVTKSSGQEYILEIENIDDVEDTAKNIHINMFFYEESQGIA